MSSTHTVPVASNLSNDIRNIFAQVTRYPLEVLDLSSGLEEDLGIDSVKLGEVFAVLREQYDLPEKLDLPREQLRTIGGIAEALQVYLKHTPPPTPALPTAPQATGSNGHEATGNGHGDTAALLEKVREIFAQVTRYPLVILEPTAALEEDLGIDSVKLGEVFAVLREQYNLPEKLDLPREQLKSIAGITEALHGYLGHFQAASPPTNGSGSATVTVLETPAPLADVTSAQSFAALTPERKPFAGKVVLDYRLGPRTRQRHCLLIWPNSARPSSSIHSTLASEVKTQSKRSRRTAATAMHPWGSVANPEHVDDDLPANRDAAYGALDFFISNASNGMLARLKDITPEHWEKAFRTNVVGLHQTALKAVELMKRRGGGKIITLSTPACPRLCRLLRLHGLQSRPLSSR